MSGAVDLNECPNAVNHCKCGMCVCGYSKHMAVHGPLYGQPPGSRPYHHEFVPREPDGFIIEHMADFLEIVDYLDNLTDTGNLSISQCVADEFDLPLEVAEWAVLQWQWLTEEGKVWAASIEARKSASRSSGN